MKTVTKLYGRFISSYYRSSDHWFKLRIVTLLNNLFIEKWGNKLIIPYFNDTWININLNDYVDRIIFQTGFYEHEVFEQLLSFATKDEVLWDIGAHIGSFSLKAINNPLVTEIHCFEPNPETFELLKLNKALNNNSFKLHLHNNGLGNKNEEVPFQVDQHGNSGRSKFVDGESETSSLNLPILTIDELVFSRGLEPPTLIKIDVEGFEKFILMGAERCFKEHPPKSIIFESKQHNNNPSDPVINSFFSKHNYIVKYVYAKDEDGSEYQNFYAFR